MNLHELLEDALARLVRALDAIWDGDFPLAEHILDDLACELERVIRQGRDA